MQIGDHIEIAVGYKLADGLCPVLPPLGDILVLRRLRSSCRVYKTVIGMCDHDMTCPYSPPIVAKLLGKPDDKVGRCE